MTKVTDKMPKVTPSLRRSVAARILATYLVVLLALLVTALINISAFGRATEDAELLRSGLVPLALHAGEFKVAHEAFSSSVTALEERNFQNRKIELGKLRSGKRGEVMKSLRGSLKKTVALGEAFELEDLVPRIQELEATTKRDDALLLELSAALEAGDEKSFLEVRRKLQQRTGRLSRGLSRLERDISALIRSLTNAARMRENIARTLLFVLGGVTILIGALMAVYARRVVSPIALVTRRARAVGAGQLSAEKPLQTKDEIGELSRTFEGMVEALVSGRERVLSSERLAAIGKMAAHVTHEIRNPLSSIALNLELLEDELPPQSEEARALLSAILAEVERLRVLSGQYLSIARQGPPETVLTDARDAINGVVEFVLREFTASGIGLERELPTTELPIDVDAGQLRQALLNLLRNAREASSEGDTVVVAAKREGDTVLIRVMDGGPGVPPEEVEHLFDPFYTTKVHGTGLGLAVTDQIVRAHGGKLWYEPARERGSCFCLSLPLAIMEI